jgi:L-ascorbate metabolism protein UlaG (beta-lactamase superfamily)
MSLIPAIIKGEALIRQVEELAYDSWNFHLWWLGQSGYLVQWKGSRLLIDPYLSDSLTMKYAASDKPHIRMSERVIDPQLLKNIRVVSSSHNHTDHLDAETLIPIIRNNPGMRFIIPEANRKFVADRIRMPLEFLTGINDSQSITIDEFIFHGVPAAHNELERDEHNRCRYMGYVIEMGKWKIYHSGDTLWYDGMEEILNPFHIDLALLPINGNDPARGVAGNLNAREAVQLAKAIGAKMVIPCHYNMFAFNTADPNEFAHLAGKVQQPFSILEPGGHWSSEALEAY